MEAAAQPEALYYPYHVCSEATLLRLLNRYRRVHFRDPNDLRLTPLQAPVPIARRMGDLFPTLLAKGKIVQGYAFPSPPDDVMRHQIDADLADLIWRTIFHNGLVLDEQFRRGLDNRPIQAALFAETWKDHPLDLDYVTSLLWGLSAESPVATYGLMTVTTSSALWQTARLSHEGRLTAVTDSRIHHALFDRALAREKDAIGRS